jgi:hypothetical protein
VYTGRPQHADLREHLVHDVILKGEPVVAPQPEYCLGPEMPLPWWEITDQCLSYDPARRPNMRQILDVMEIYGIKCPTRTSRRIRRLQTYSPKRNLLSRSFQVTVTRSCVYVATIHWQHCDLSRHRCVKARRRRSVCG